MKRDRIEIGLGGFFMRHGYGVTFVLVMDEITFAYQGRPDGISVEISPAALPAEAELVVAPMTMY